MITSMNAMVMPMAIRQLVATHGARTPVPSTGALAGGTWAIPVGTAAAVAPAAVALAAAALAAVAPTVGETAAAPGPGIAPAAASTGRVGATRATARL